MRHCIALVLAAAALVAPAVAQAAPQPIPQALARADAFWRVASPCPSGAQPTLVLIPALPAFTTPYADVAAGMTSESVSCTILIGTYDWRPSALRAAQAAVTHDPYDVSVWKILCTDIVRVDGALLGESETATDTMSPMYVGFYWGSPAAKFCGNTPS